MHGNGTVSKVATLRAMAVAPDTTTLVEIKATDAAYPLYGRIILENNGSLQNATAFQDGATVWLQIPCFWDGSA